MFIKNSFLLQYLLNDDIVEKGTVTID